MPLFVCARPEIYCGSGAPHLLGPSDLPYRTDYPSYATRTLSWRWLRSNQESLITTRLFYQLTGYSCMEWTREFFTVVSVIKLMRNCTFQLFS